MKKVLIITNYFPPEMGAASNRIHHLAKCLGKDFKVSVLCPLPNYPKGEIFEAYKGKLYQKEFVDGISIYRLWIYASNSKNNISRLLAMLSFSFSLVWFFITHRIPKTVIVQSPPLLVAFTALIFLSPKRHHIILNVSDLWPSAGLELGALKKGIGFSFLKWVERYNYKKANVVLGQSEETLGHISSITQSPKLLLYRNYPDFVPPVVKDTSKEESKKISIVYAGLLGVAQGILKLCENLDYNNIDFHIYGSGAEEKDIVLFIKNNPNLPITFHGSLKREQLHVELPKYAITIIPLLKRIYGSVPSKLFEYARLGLPVIYFGGGEGESIVKQYNLGWTAKASDYSDLNRVISNINKNEITVKARRNIQETAIKNFNSEHQIELLKQVL